MAAENLPELFHAIADAPSATARKLVISLGLEGKVRFRNAVYPEVQADLSARGGTLLPALWDGVALHQGLEQVDRELRALLGRGDGSGGAA